MKPLISIIIPVYKTEEYLSECIDSILSQDIDNIEILLINDGSPDKCGEICEDYARRDSRIRVFHRENAGASESRNYGIKNAFGSYIMFLDSDDFLEEKCMKIIEAIVSENKLDIVLGKFNYYYQSKNDKRTVPFEYDASKVTLREGKEILSYLFDEIPEQTWAAWRNIYNREFILTNNLFFKRDLVIGEDIDWFIKVMLCAKVVSFNNNPHVCYRLERPESITNSLDLKKCTDSINLSKYWIDFAEDSKLPQTIKQSIYNRFAFNFAAVFLQLNKVSKLERKSLIKLINNNINLLNYSNRANIKLIKLFQKVFGSFITAKLFEFRSRIKNS
ncbi:glycosyltransferase family 2 protein [Ureibacillus sp. MALMAid1270]|uniref:glycosyltransferase family 2 protein n=1 Tax=Ureibacillus sp. MALMAid1270 TaxID=3411629 RepID=UPI003BA7BA05